MPGVMAVDPGVRGVDVPLRAERERADSDRLVSVPMDTGTTAAGQRVDHFPQKWSASAWRRH